MNAFCRNYYNKNYGTKFGIQGIRRLKGLDEKCKVSDMHTLVDSS